MNVIHSLGETEPNFVYVIVCYFGFTHAAENLIPVTAIFRENLPVPMNGHEFTIQANCTSAMQYVYLRILNAVITKLGLETTPVSWCNHLLSL